MNTPVLNKEKQSGRPRAFLFGYNQSHTGKLFDLLNTPEYLNSLDFQRSDFQSPAHCDLALALLSRGESIDKYLDDIITLKTRTKISNVIALIDSRQKDAFAKVHKRCLANKVVYFPLNTATLAKIIMDQLGIVKSLPPAKKKRLGDVIQASAAAIIEESTARTHTCIGVKSEKKHLVVAMVDTSDLNLVDMLRDQTGMVIKPVAADKNEITRAIEDYYPKAGSDLSAGLADSGASGRDSAMPPSLRHLGMDTSLQSRISSLVLGIISNGIRDRASDIHLDSGSSDIILKYRIDGELRRVLLPAKDSRQAIVNTVKMLAGMNIEENNLPQQGKFTLDLANITADLNVSCVPVQGGEKLVLSVINKETFDPDLKSLGLRPDDLSLVQKYLEAPFGMIVVSGPRAAGRSSTLYALLKEVMSESKNLVTIEESVRAPLPGATQIKVDESLGFTSASAAAAMQAQDPDIVMVDPVTEKSTCQLLTKMALTGHQTFTSIEGSSCVETIGKLKDLGVTGLSLGSALNLVISQRHIKKICPDCRAPAEPASELLDSLGLDKNSRSGFYQGKGCDSCNKSGFKGSAVIFEVLPIEKNLRKLILGDASEADIQKQVEQLNFKTLKNAANDLAASGITTVEQALAV